MWHITYDGIAFKTQLQLKEKTLSLLINMY